MADSSGRERGALASRLDWADWAARRAEAEAVERLTWRKGLRGEARKRKAARPVTGERLV